MESTEQLGYHSCNFKGEKQPSWFCSAHNLSFKNNPHVFAVHAQNTRAVFDP